jgi:rhamnogalacturonyl hydrolase YesR
MRNSILIGKKTFLVIGYMSILILSSFLTAANTQELPSKEEIRLTMEKVDDYWIANHLFNPGNACWARSAYFTGNMALYYASQKVKYLDYSIDWAVQNNWETGNCKPPTHADSQCSGQTYIELYNIDPIPSRLTSITEAVNIQVNRSEVDDWWWVDALFMAMPVFAKLCNVYENPIYCDKMYELYEDTKNRRALFDSDEGLWYRDEDFKFPSNKTPNGRKIFWSRGNGWGIASLARVLQVLPTDNWCNRCPEYRIEYIDMLQTMASALKDIQRSDGFWNVSLYDPNDYPGPETSGTAFFTYAIAWGINNGHLDKDTYLPIVTEAWNGMVKDAVHMDGFLGYVQGAGKEPASSQPVTYNSTADFGVGAFLLAGSEVNKLSTPSITVTASSYQEPNIPENTLDNNLDTRWSALGDGEWIQYDLGEIQLVKDVSIAFFIGDQRTAFFDIVISEDGTSWTPVLEDGQSSGTTLNLQTYDFNDLTARYVRIVGHGNTENNWNSITEVEIYGKNSGGSWRSRGEQSDGEKSLTTVQNA